VSTWISRIVLFALLLLSMIFGMLNGSMIELDFGVARWNLPLGVALLGFLAIGAVVGSLATYLTVVPKLRAQQRDLVKKLSSEKV
jgi:uncharacterized integral membrane protein